MVLFDLNINNDLTRKKNPILDRPRSPRDYPVRHFDRTASAMIEDIQSDRQDPSDPPPEYDDKTETPIPIAIGPDYLSKTPEKLIMRGHYRSPDFEIVRSDGLRIMELETQCSMVDHQTFVENTLTGSKCFTIRRKPTTRESDVRSFYANRPGKDGKRIFEVDTKPGLWSGKWTSSRLVFHNTLTDSMDAVDLKLKSNGKVAEVLHQGGRKLGEITTEYKSKPEFVLDLQVRGVDLMLFVILAYVIDDRVMTQRRRLRRRFGRGASGVGKGPGALSAGFLVLGGLG